MEEKDANLQKKARNFGHSRRKYYLCAIKTI